MAKILMITEAPNGEYSSKEDLFDIKKNGFLQFFARILFGDEGKTRNCFNPDMIDWKHAKGSSIKDDKDGLEYIRNELIVKVKYDLILTFGLPALKVFLNTGTKMEDALSDKLTCMKEKEKKLNRKVPRNSTNQNTSWAIFPHTSGQAQRIWIDNADKISKLIVSVQGLTTNIYCTREQFAIRI